MLESTLPPRRRYTPEMKLEIVHEAIVVTTESGYFPITELPISTD